MSKTLSGVNAKEVVKYVAMPGIMPRFRRLFGSGFGYIALLMAQIYAMVRLLPPDHPYLDSRNIGRFGIRHVVAAAANNLVLSKKNIDQVVIFILIMGGIVLLAFQIVMLVGAFLLGSGVALAGGITWATLPSTAQIFTTAAPSQDIAFMLLDRVFGVPGFFNSCVADTGTFCVDSLGANIPNTNAAFPWPFHIALHQFFRFYSTGILLIATIVFLYYIVVVVAETTTTGTPFGQRFQNVWVPIRLVIALGLLIPLPINYGAAGTSAAYNSGQYIAFAAAKYGSSLATNAWIQYNEAVLGHPDVGTANRMNPLGEPETLISAPKQQSMGPLVETMSIMHACAFMHFHMNVPENIDKRPLAGGAYYPEDPSDIFAYLGVNNIKAYLVKNRADWMPAAEPLGLELTTGTSYQQALDFFYKGDIIITFGYLEEPADPISPDNVVPACGRVRVAVGDGRDSAGGTGIYPASTTPYLGGVAVQQEYFNFIRNAWLLTAISEDYLDFVGRLVLYVTHMDTSIRSPCDMGCAPAPNPNLPACGGTPRLCEIRMPGAQWKQNRINQTKINMDTRLLQIWQAYRADISDIAMDPNLMLRGWGGAGIWFNKIAQINGAWYDAISNQPSFIEYPLVMETVMKARAATSKQLDGAEIFNPAGDDESATSILQELAKLKGDGFKMATVMYQLMNYWRGDQQEMDKVEKGVNGDVMEAAMNMLFGTYGLFSMRENSQTHPLVQLTSLGKGLVETAIRNIAISTGSSVGGGLFQILGRTAGSMVGIVSQFFSSIAFMGLTAGLVLYYIVPFLPFVYFYFAVASWIKTIFEAMVGIPLWALAHLRLDGDGLPGDSAANGYFLIFEIFVRPVLTVVGLIAAFAIFTAQVRILHFVWQLVIENAGGFNEDALIVGFDGNDVLKRSVADEFFFTITYAIVVYMMATAAFKLVDTIPDNILRWMGQGVSSFGDINQDPTGELTRYAALGGLTAGREVAQATSKLGGAVGGGLGGFMARWNR